MKKIPAKYRKALYIVAVVLIAVSVIAGWLTTGDVERIIVAAEKVVALAATLLALGNITPDGVGS